MNALNLDVNNPDYQSLLNKNGWEATTHWNLPENHRLKFYTYKDSSGYLTTTCSVCKWEDNGSYSSEQFVIGVAGEGDMYYRLERGKIRVTEAAVKRQHEAAINMHFGEMVNQCFNQYKGKMKLDGPVAPTTTPTSTAQQIMTNVTINAEQQMFVIPCGDGYSTWGFENCYNETFQLAKKLNMPLPLQAQIGTIEQYNQHRAMIDHVAKNNIDLGTWFDLKTDPVVKHVIEEYLRSQRPVWIFYGDTDTGKVWLDEHDVYGRIGRSTGFLKIPLMIVGNRSGGCGLLDACILRIVDGETKRERYRHPKYQEPKFTLGPAISKDYHEAVYVDGEVHAQFKKPGQAANWIAYMKGERMKP